MSTLVSKWLSAYGFFVAIVVLMGCGIFISGVMDWQSADPIRGYFFLLLALVTSGMKLNFPQIVGAMSVNFVFVLLGILELSFSETLLMGCAATAVQVLVHRQAARVPAPALFHVANTAIAVTIAWRVTHSPWVGAGQYASVLGLVMAASVLYVMNTFPVAAVVTLSQRRNLAVVWRECNFRTFPYYIAGACLAAVFHFSSQLVGGQSPVLLLPVAFLIYCSYHSYTGRKAAQKVYAEDMSALHLRTIEALAMAIEAKDMTAHNHIRRLQLYCVEAGKELRLPAMELEALRAAAVLHDIGKLAVPEHILSKPGKLTREEFEKVKIHAGVGAEILERVNFPYPVARIVRCHHEKWNGGGYPSGLKGEVIPIGARILAAVDCFDALISDRPYRPAISKQEALNRLSAEAGVSFDSRVVDVIRARYLDWEKMLGSEEAASASYQRDVATEMMFPTRKIEAAPVAADVKEPEKPAFMDSIFAARREAQVLFELTQELGNSLHLDETLSVLATGLRRMVPFDSLVIYIVREGTLVPRYATGECTSLFLSRQISLGQGIAGWVAVQRKPILNGNPTVELGQQTESMRNLLLNSAVAVPLPGLHGIAGVVMLSRHAFDAFNKDNLRVLLAVSSKLGSVIENAIKYEQAAASASTDFLTGLPNARALYQQLESELARTRRLGGTLTVLVTDLDGFKEVNDRFGHLEGNAVLRAVAKTMRETCRDYDYVARLGGDEFVILLPGLEENDIGLKIAQLNRAVAEAGKQVVPESSLSLSVGQARFPNDGDHPDGLLAEADQRMYQAKTTRKLKMHHGTTRGYDFDWVEPTSLPQ